MAYKSKFIWLNRFIFSIPENTFQLIRPILLVICAFLYCPILLTFFVLSSSAVLYTYKLINQSKLEYTDSRTFWKKPVTLVSQFWATFGNIWNGHEIIGLENIPENESALIILFHAPLPIDFFYFGAKIYLYNNRLIRVITHRDAFNKFGFESIAEALELTSGQRQACIEMLQNDELVVLSPGGVREALFSDNYNLMWNGKKGFAKVAIDAKTSIIPVFTQNCQEIIFRSRFLNGFFRYLYEMTKIPFIPTFGWFPVKLRTFIGKPICYSENRSTEELVQLTQDSLRNLIRLHQRVPSSYISAILDRLL